MRSDFQKENANRQRLLDLYRALEQYIDADRPLTTNQICNLIQNKHEIYMHLDSVYNGIGFNSIWEKLKRNLLVLSCRIVENRRFFVLLMQIMKYQANSYGKNVYCS